MVTRDGEGDVGSLMSIVAKELLLAHLVRPVVRERDKEAIAAAPLRGSEAEERWPPLEDSGATRGGR